MVRATARERSPLVSDENNGHSGVPRRFQMRVTTTPDVRRQFLEICRQQNQIPNRVIGRWLERAVKNGNLGRL